MNMQKRQNGITLIEMITSFAVVAILLGLSVPSYSGFIAKRQVAGASNMISVFFENVKMQSIKRSEFVTISYQTGEDEGSWCLGAVLGKNAPCDCMAVPVQCLIESEPTLLSNQTYSDFDGIQASFVDGFVTFDPVRGILVNSDDSVLMTVKHTAEDFQVKVSVNATGSVRKCTPADHILVGQVVCL